MIKIVFEGKVEGSTHEVELHEFVEKLSDRLVANITKIGKGLDAKAGESIAEELTAMLSGKMRPGVYMTKASTRRGVEKSIDGDVSAFLMRRLGASVKDVIGKEVYGLAESSIGSAVQDLIDERRR